MHQTSTGTKKTKKTKNPATTQKWTHSSWRTKKTKPLDAPNIDRHQKNKKKQKIQQLLRSGPIVPGNFVFFGACAGLVHLVVCFFLFFLVPVQVWWLWLHKTLTGTKKNKKTKPLDAPNIDRHQKKQKKQKILQLLRSGPIVPGNFSFFVFFGACAGLVHLVVCFFCFFWCLCRFGASIGLFVFFWCLCRFWWF